MERATDLVVPKDIASEQAVNRVARPSGRFADFSEIGVHTCLCLKLVGGRGWRDATAIVEMHLDGTKCFLGAGF